MKWESLGVIKLLIVDDDSFNRQLVISLLAPVSTISFVEAEDGEEALSILKQKKIDMVLLDLHMPKMDGYETLRAIKQESKYDLMPVAIVTTDEQEMNTLYALGADDFISKPFKLSELESRIYAHIEKKQYRQKYQELSQNKIKKTVIESEETTVEDEDTAPQKCVEKTENYTLEVIEASQKKFFSSMAKLLAHRTKNHEEIQSVALLSKALSLLLGYDKDIANTIYNATLIREIGKLSLEKSISLSFSFSEEEQKIHQQTILSAYKLFSSSIETDFIKVAKIVVLQSYEHYNGEGFPKQHKEQEIHNIAYIVSLVASFNALLSQKEYLNQKIHTTKETYEILQNESGKRFHPKITKLFLMHFEYFTELRNKIIK